MTIPAYRLGHWTATGPVALLRATPWQRRAWHRIRSTGCQMQWVTLLSNGVLRITFRRDNGRRADAFVARDGSRLATTNHHRSKDG